MSCCVKGAVRAIFRSREALRSAFNNGRGKPKVV